MLIRGHADFHLVGVIDHREGDIKGFQCFLVLLKADLKRRRVELVQFGKTAPRHHPPPAVLSHPDVTTQARYFEPHLVQVHLIKVLDGFHRLPRIRHVIADQSQVYFPVSLLEYLSIELKQRSPKFLFVFTRDFSKRHKLIADSRVCGKPLFRVSGIPLPSSILLLLPNMGLRFPDQPLVLVFIRFCREIYYVGNISCRGILDNLCAVLHVFQFCSLCIFCLGFAAHERAPTRLDAFGRSLFSLLSLRPLRLHLAAQPRTNTRLNASRRGVFRSLDSFSLDSFSLSPLLLGLLGEVILHFF